MKISNPLTGWKARHNTALDRNGNAPEIQKHEGYDDTPLPRLTWASFSMGVLVSMGGFVFGYDTGQISGFLGMEDFLDRFGQRSASGTAYFSNVRAGLIVGLVSIEQPISTWTRLTYQAFDWYSIRRSDCSPNRGFHRPQKIDHVLVCHILCRYDSTSNVHGQMVHLTIISEQDMNCS